MYMEFAKRLSPEALPDWPLGLSEALAAAYLSMSPSLFRTEVAAGRLPQPVRITVGRRVWHRDHLTQWLTDQAAPTPIRHQIGKAKTPKEWD